MKFLSLLVVCFVANESDCACTGEYVVKCEHVADVEYYGTPEWKYLIIGGFGSVPNETLTSTALESCRNLEELTIISTINEVEHIALGKLPNLAVLRLYNNSLEEIPRVDIQYQLIKVDAQYNNIENVPSIFSLSEIKILNLSHNKLKNLAWRALDVRGLRRLTMTHNEISELSNKNIFSSTLEYLNMDNNKLEDIKEHMFEEMDKLEELILSNNRFSSLWVKWENKNLKTLDLSHNIITVIAPGVFENMPSLAHLYLNHNFIKQLPLQLFRSNLQQLNLVTLYLHSNRLEDLQFLLKDSLPTLQEISIAGNPFPCDCLDMVLYFIGKKEVDLSPCDYQYFNSGNFPVCISFNSTFNGECVQTQLPLDVYDEFLKIPKRFHCLHRDSGAYEEIQL